MPVIQDFDSDLLDMAKLIKCMAHPARISILKEVARIGECGPEHELDIAQLSPLTIKQHLREMKKTGIVSGRIFGKNSSYSINWERFSELQKFLELYFNEMEDFKDIHCAQT